MSPRAGLRSVALPAALARSSPSVAGLAAGDLIRENNPLLRLSRDGTSAEVGIASGATWVWTGAGMVPLPFTTPAAFALVGEAVHVVSGPGARSTSTPTVAWRPPTASQRKSVVWGRRSWPSTWPS
jgi:hypothetical protein